MKGALKAMWLRSGSWMAHPTTYISFVFLNFFKYELLDAPFNDSVKKIRETQKKYEPLDALSNNLDGTWKVRERAQWAKEAIFYSLSKHCREQKCNSEQLHLKPKLTFMWLYASFSFTQFTFSTSKQKEITYIHSK